MNETFLHSLLLATALMLVIEGLTPFINPAAYRRVLLQMVAMKDQHIRTIGFFSMIAGLVILYWAN